MRMPVNSRALAVLIDSFVWLLWCTSLSYASVDDIACLKTIKASLEDPLNYLSSSWNFNNATEGYICKFTGIECWHPDENKVLNIRLSGMGLKGEFPVGVANCTSLTGLDLSSNNIYGTIPSNIPKLVEFVTTLDLSSNNLSGEIPVNLSRCSYLNVLKLDSNQLTGQIPAELGLLSRIKTFSVANNRLTGQVPHFGNTSIAAENYANNAGLCGRPLPDCRGPPRKTHTGVIIGAAVGGVTLAVLAVLIAMLFCKRRVAKKKKEDDPEGNKWARSIKGAKGIKARGTGTMYKAVLVDGTSLMVKRLQDTQHSEKEFASEMATLGNVKNRNLVPLLGFCMAKRERLLVYKYMPNGTLHDKLHFVGDDGTSMEWPMRLKIGIGAAKGFAWLHHSCNPRIIHRNISSKCILLDANFEPKISDFGLARLMNPIDTHLSTFVNGEFGDLGYVAPEYARTLVATPKGDVYSFGVVLLELVTGERSTYVSKAPESFKGNLVEWITELSSNSKLQDAIDKSLANKGYDGELFQVLKVACNCVQLAHKERPSMFEVYQLLRAIGERYHFTTDDEILMASDLDTTDHIELIVARESKENY
ncbi:hypothetical protein RJ640_025303 [Escallonia rubra]|uniref:Protein kinase domain-containing protein n=1 Tax=Escallonia rubra TaxID=112253 RepID=A0AA88QC65_9ASTE|nr:hypothetical protein RJ640_025303 [Escallonia rubra]